MSDLFVFFGEEFVGKIVQKADATLNFSYSSSWLHSKQSFALTPVLPLEHQVVFDNRATRSFFDNLLPEGRVRGLLEKLVGKSLTSDLEFLKEYGSDCAGAFIVTDQESYPSMVVQNEFEEIKPQELARAYLDNKNLMAHVMEKHDGRFSLAGAQDKVPLIYHEGKLYIPTKGAATTHILKPPHLSKTVKDSVYNEYFVMELARAAGLMVPEVFVIEGDVPFYVVERFDRAFDGDHIIRQHQIDFCQAQGRLHSEKYESDGGPTLKDNYFCIRDHGHNVIDDTRTLMKWISFNLLIGNNDCHSKNISFSRHPKGYRLSPFYDLLCTSIYKEYSDQFAFSLGGNRYWGQWKKIHFEKEMIEWGLSKSPELFSIAFNGMMEKLLEIIDHEQSAFNERFPKIKVAGRIREELLLRSRSFSKRLK
jgi:serine/threonine-protein kinase HipA